RDKFLMAGIEISDVVDHGHIYSIYAFDPNNISIEFSYETYNPRNSPIFMDPDPIEVLEFSVTNKTAIAGLNKLEIPPSHLGIQFPTDLKLSAEERNRPFDKFAYDSYYHRVNREALFYDFQGSHTIFLATSDLKETLDFYVGKLGFKVYYAIGLGENSSQFRFYLVECSHNLSLAFFCWPGVKKTSPKVAGKPSPYYYRYHFDSLSFGVPTEAQFREVYSIFSNGQDNHPEVVNRGNSFAFSVFDPNNVAVVFECHVLDYSKRPLLFADSTAREHLPQPGQWPTILDATPKGLRKVLPGVGWDFIPAEMKNAEFKVNPDPEDVPNL
ncbi:MAG TPA: VOC family protein, partial [Candidatus Hodarchaeales archaeon]|nr:VOC family protein [Candidatus Hodarchaeales archaeon]